MATTKKNRKPTVVDGVAYEDLLPSQQVGHDIRTSYPDLAPSVQRILDAELDEDQRLKAMHMFQEALGSPTDPNRDPRNVIAACS